MLENKKPFLIVLALAVVLVAGAALITLKGKNPADERGTLTGITVDAADDSLLKGVTVTAVDQYGVHYTSHEYTDTTGNDGFFSLELPPNDYTLAFAADGYQPLESTASYKVKNGKTLEIKEDFRLVTVSSSKPESDPNSSSAAGNASSSTGEPSMGQAAAEQASATSTGSQTLPEQSTASTGNGQTSSEQPSAPSSGGQSPANASAMSSGSMQTASNTSAASSGNMQSATNPSAMTSGNTQTVRMKQMPLTAISPISVSGMNKLSSFKSSRSIFPPFYILSILYAGWLDQGHPASFKSQVFTSPSATGSGTFRYFVPVDAAFFRNYTVYCTEKNE